MSINLDNIQTWEEFASSLPKNAADRQADGLSTTIGGGECEYGRDKNYHKQLFPSCSLVSPCQPICHCKLLCR